MKKLLGIVVLGLLLSGNAYAEIVNRFCLIGTNHLKDSKLDPKEYVRFAGKVIKFKINLDENLIYDVSEYAELSVISGINQGSLKIIKNGSIINFKNEFDVKGDKNKNIKYSYNNKIYLKRKMFSVQDSFGFLNSQVSQLGFSLKKFNFKIPCRSYEYTEDEKISAGFPTFKSRKKKMICGKGSSEKCFVVPKKEAKDNKNKEAKDNKNDIVNLENYAAINNNVDTLLYLYKAKLFKNNVNNYVFLKNRNYLKFERGQQLTFKDIKELSEKHFFGLPLHNSSDRDRLKKLKKEYLSKKKAIKDVG